MFDKIDAIKIIKHDWWKNQFTPRLEEFGKIESSGKLALLFSILEDASNDKILVFSQSLESLTMIEHFLGLIDRNCTTNVEWKAELDYFRLDGKTNIDKRKLYCDRFNSDDKRARFAKTLKL